MTPRDKPRPSSSDLTPLKPPEPASHQHRGGGRRRRAEKPLSATEKKAQAAHIKRQQRCRYRGRADDAVSTTGSASASVTAAYNGGVRPSPWRPKPEATRAMPPEPEPSRSRPRSPKRSPPSTPSKRKLRYRSRPADLSTPSPSSRSRPTRSHRNLTAESESESEDIPSKKRQPRIRPNMHSSQATPSTVQRLVKVVIPGLSGPYPSERLGSARSMSTQVDIDGSEAFWMSTAVDIHSHRATKPSLARGSRYDSNHRSVIATEDIDDHPASLSAGPSQINMESTLPASEIDAFSALALEPSDDAVIIANPRRLRSRPRLVPQMPSRVPDESTVWDYREASTTSTYSPADASEASSDSDPVIVPLSPRRQRRPRSCSPSTAQGWQSKARDTLAAASALECDCRQFCPSSLTPVPWISRSLLYLSDSKACGPRIHTNAGAAQRILGSASAIVGLDRHPRAVPSSAVSRTRASGRSRQGSPGCPGGMEGRPRRLRRGRAPGLAQPRTLSARISLFGGRKDPEDRAHLGRRQLPRPGDDACRPCRPLRVLREAGLRQPVDARRSYHLSRPESPHHETASIRVERLVARSRFLLARLLPPHAHQP